MKQKNVCYEQIRGKNCEKKYLNECQKCSACGKVSNSKEILTFSALIMANFIV